MKTTLSRGASLLFAGICALPNVTAAQTNGFVLHCLSARAAGEGCVTRAREDVPTNGYPLPS